MVGSRNQEITLDHLQRMQDAIALIFPKGPFDAGADMSQETFDQLKRSGNFQVFKPEYTGVASDVHSGFFGIDIHIVPSIPVGIVEPCKCKERQRHG